MPEKLVEYKERLAVLQEKGGISAEAQVLLEEILLDLAEKNRSNKAMRQVILKTGKASTMSTRLREALYE
ncbi:hypothetical protein H1230_10575 [Paenibacillus sp. 19GGS1-52]|uniref:hypothetical protein n=1 Tax=Paenibacillus sp. 19GGS1-52 TaxID=2758563 RepID=UPI001EFB896C|nr:hypothetical protein [Paenibacillus sp. 19GGS1-52]ULO09170.1 hypothetical protein H1230_10575 [Paenibacillus sp. 19GGS1-52]